ncbi:MAG: hypothetical protein KAT16_04125 [Candidatus Heimdallarchaeota archaeon]|nr:hypothetical protein [Candidatus Heimdallarchaeota archaeon]
MNKLYRIIIGSFLVILGIIFLILTNIFRSDSIESSSSSDPSFYPLVFIIAILVVIVVPAVFVVVRLIRR